MAAEADGVARRSRLNLTKHGAIAVVDDIREADLLAWQFQQVLMHARNCLVLDYEVLMPGLGVLTPWELPPRKVRANFRGPDAPVYEIGARRTVRFLPGEPLRRAMDYRDQAAERLREGIEVDFGEAR